MPITQELKTTVAKLPHDELLQFAQWFEEFMADQWDQQIEADIFAGRLNAARKYADDEFMAGRLKPL